MIQLFKSFPFEAARKLNRNSFPFQRLHGHSFCLTCHQNWPETQHPENWEQMELQLAPVLVQLDYSFLNESLNLSDPSDVDIIKWCLPQLDELDLETLQLRSAPETHAMYHNSSFFLSHQLEIHAAHYLPNVPPGHKCGRLHGHNFQIGIQWQPEQPPYVTHFEELLKLFAPIHERLQGQFLNHIPGLENPTSENLCTWLWNSFKSILPSLTLITTFETPNSGSRYDGNQWSGFKAFSMDSAIEGPSGPMGHTYLVRLYILKAKLDETLGWTRDFGEINELFNPLFKQLDHHALMQVNTLDSSSTIHLAQWIDNQLSPQLNDLHKIEIWDTKHTGVIYSTSKN
ncbi:6-carboxytetrahydropterin synthase [Deltaproteobacteria bacterium TL4]